MDLEQEITEQEASINVNGGVKNVCSFCNATKTPLWRAGPSGPKSLCNACGIKYTKKMRASAMGLEKAGRRTEMKKKRVGETLKVRLKELEREMVLQRSDRNKSQKLGEEERAALLLMALSYGYVYG